MSLADGEDFPNNFDDDDLSPAPVVASSVTAEIEDVDFGEEDDKESFDALITWLSGKVEILPSKIKRYSAQFVQAGIGSIKRLAKKIKKTPEFLESLEIVIDDADEINEVLSREGIFEAIRLEKLAAQKAEEGEAESHTVAAPAIITRSRAPSMAPPIVEPLELRSRQGTMTSESEVPAYLNNPYAYTYVNDHTEDDVHQSGTSRARKHTMYTARKLSDAKIDLLATEVAEIMHALKSAVDEEDDMACVEALEYIASIVEGNLDKQRAFQRAFAHLGILSAMNALMGNTEVCEKACRCIALLCRCGEDKGTTNYENCKAFGLSNASDAIITAFKKHADNEALVEAACDSIRSMCNLESNKQRFYSSGASEVIAGALSNFSADPVVCAWICRTMGHLAQSNEDNKESLGENLATANLILALQNHQKNDSVCTEIFWAIRNLAYGHQENRSRFSTEFAPESITVAFSRHVQIEVLAVEATTALVSLINDEEDEVIGRIASSGAMTFVIRAMKKSPECESLAYRAFQLLYFCASCQDSSLTSMIKRKLTSNDFLEVMSTAFENHAGDSGVAEWGCRLLHILIDSNSQAKMRNAGLCEMVVSAVQRQAISDYICAIGCLAIGDLALEVSNHDRLAAAGACEAACGALRRHDDNIEVVIQACYAIHFLSFTQNNVGWIGANGGCEAVVQSLVKHTNTNVDVTQFAARALGSLAFKDEGNMVRIFDAGGCAAIVVALRTHSKDREVSEYACRAIFHLCGDNANVSDLGAKGACGLVVQVFIMHMTIAEVCAQACLAVSGLAVKIRSDKEHKGNTRKLFARGAVDNVVQCLRTYPDQHEVIRAGAMAITALSRIDANRQQVGETGVCDLLINGLTQHSTQPECIAKIAQAIEMLSQPIKENDVIISDANREKFSNAGVAEILISLLRKHDRCSEVVLEVLRALIILSTHPASRKAVWSDDACKLYVKVMKIHEKVEDVARWACNMIYSLAIDNTARIRLGLAKASEGVVNVLMKHAATNANVVRYACRAICGLAELDANKRKFNTSDACTSIVTALKSHLSDADIGEWGCFAIVSICPNAGNRHKFFLAGACPIVNKVLAQHMESDIVTTLASEAIRELSYYVDNRLQLGAVGTCETLAKALEMHLDSHEVATHACRAIAGIAFTHAGNAAKLGDSGVCDMLLRGLQMHWPITSFVEWAYAAVSVMAEKQKQNQEEFRLGDIATITVSALLRHASSDGVCFQACKAIRCLTFGNEELKGKFASAGISPVVLNCMQKHEASSLVVENASWVLGNILCYEGRDDVSKMEPIDGDTRAATIPAPFSTQEGGPKPSFVYYSNPLHWETLVTALQAHVTKAQTVRWVCCALACFADRSKTEHLRACEMVMQALSLHADALSVCNKILVCLGALAHSHVKNSARLGKLKACEEVGSILTRSEEEPSIHGCFCAIAGLANASTANQARFNAVPSLAKDIVQKLYDMFEKPNIARWGCSAISALCYKNHDHQSKLGKASNFISDIIEQHIKIKAIVRDAVRAAACLAHNHITNRNRLGAGGCCEWVPRVMASPAFSQDGTVMIWAVRVVADLAANNPNNQSKLGMHGACEVLVKCITVSWATSAEDEAMAKYALWAIGNLVQLSKDAGIVVDEEGKRGIGMVSSTKQAVKNTARLGEAGVVHAVLQLISKYESSAVVCRWSCRAINNLAKSAKIRAQLNHLKVRWVLESISKRYSHDKGMVEWSTIAQDTLINGVVAAQSPNSAHKNDSISTGSPRTSFSSVADKLSLGLGFLADSASDSILGNSADKNKARSRSMGEKEFLESKASPKATIDKKKNTPTKTSSTNAAPGAATTKAIAALSAATTTPTPKVGKKPSAVPVDTPKTTMQPADPSTDSPMPSSESASPMGAILTSSVATPTVDPDSEDYDML